MNLCSLCTHLHSYACLHEALFAVHVRPRGGPGGGVHTHTLVLGHQVLPGCKGKGERLCERLAAYAPTPLILDKTLTEVELLCDAVNVLTYVVMVLYDAVTGLYNNVTACVMCDTAEVVCGVRSTTAPSPRWYPPCPPRSPKSSVVTTVLRGCYKAY
jgi:hypothetical protein